MKTKFTVDFIDQGYVYNSFDFTDYEDALAKFNYGVDNLFGRDINDVKVTISEVVVKELKHVNIGKTGLELYKGYPGK